MKEFNEVEEAAKEVYPEEHHIRVLERAAFVMGARWQLGQTQDKPQLRWVKASEQQPESYHDVHVRVSICGKDYSVYTGDKELLLDDYYLERIEWLDESGQVEDKPTGTQEK